MERLVERLPGAIFKEKPDSRHVVRRLRLSVGAPGLDMQDRSRRLRVVTAAVTAYQEVCDLLHGRNPDPNPPLPDVDAWAVAIRALERELDRSTSPLHLRRPPQRPA